MSDPQPPAQPPSKALMIGCGIIILLLPGICTSISVAMFIAYPHGPFRDDPSLMVLWLVFFGVAAGGVVMIRNALKRER